MSGPWPFAPLRPGGFELIVADPPWPFAAWSAKGQGKSPEAHYSTMRMADIAALPVAALLATDGVLLLWCTFPLLARQAEIAVGWGFTVKTGGVWAKRTASGKLRWGTGYLLRSVCEPFLLATRGAPDLSGGRGLANLIETFTDAAIDGLAREHSRKPDEFYALCEKLSPDARRLELFARTRRPGWRAFGDETGRFGAGAGP